MHLNTELAFDMIDRRFEPQQYRFWTEHVTSCDHCRREVERCEALRKYLKREHLKSAPSEQIRRAVKVFPVTEPEISTARRLLAILLFDSSAQQALAGTRGAVDARHLVLRAEEFDIHVKIWGSAEHRHMIGQLLRRDGREYSQGARLHLLRSGVRIETTTMDETGEFRFDEISAGPLGLQIDLPETIIIVPLNDPG